MAVLDYAGQRRNESANRMVALGLAVALIICYCIIVIAAGHGVAPLGLFLVWGLKTWFLPVILAYGGMAFCGASIVLTQIHSHMLLRTIGGLLLCVSAVWFVTKSEAMWMTLMTAVPFLAAAIGWFATMGAKQGKKD